MARRSPKSAGARHHAEWLSLVETSGPFLSLPVLLRAFPQGLDAEDPGHQRELRLAIDEWEEAQAGEPDRAIHTAWIRFVLTRTLELPAEVLAEGAAVPAALRVAIPEQGETLAPDIVVVNPSGMPAAGRPRLLIQTYPSDQALGRAVAGRRWKASPETRLLELLRSTGARLGLATNGEHWLLANAMPNGSPGTASWYASLWTDEPVTLRAFRSLLGARRFFSAAETDTLEALLDESAANQQEVTDQLGLQVRHAVEVLVRSVDRANRDHAESLLRGVSEEQLYQAAVTVMMRLVFLFAAEERGLLLLGDPLFDQHYAVSTLRAQLREAADQHGEDVLERRYDAWARLLATFRAVHGGIAHDRLRLPAYGGTLFDPDRFPFLEGRSDATTWRTTAASPLPIHNRTVLHLLEALQLLAVQVPGGGAEARKLSFKALDIEQIGHVYEGLLDHTARRARTPVLGLEGTQKKEPEVPLDQLEALRAKGEDDLVSFLKEATGRSVPALRKKLAYDPDSDDEQRFVVSCDNDEGLYGRVRPFIGLVREDTFHEPVVIPTGSVYVTAGTDRRETGTHYTQRSLTEPIVQHALEPLVYVGPAEGTPREQWVLRPAAEVLALRVCDPAMGSGAFLVQACRFLSERLVEAWEAAERLNPSGLGITPAGAPSSGDPGELLIPHDTEERLALARRLVADRCLYGVDINPMAVEMAKLSLWLVTLQKDRSFTFLDHALRPGDSLLGITSSDQIEWMHLDPSAGHQLAAWALAGRPALAAAVTKRRELEGFPVVDIGDAERKARLLVQAQQALEGVHALANLVVGAALAKARGDLASIDDVFAPLEATLEGAFDQGGEQGHRLALIRDLDNAAQRLLGRGRDGSIRLPFHWVLEFPEVFQDSGSDACGFDAVVANPPFKFGTLASTDLSPGYMRYVQSDNVPLHGKADLSVGFLRRAARLLRPAGHLGMLLTSSVLRGESFDSGLGHLSLCGWRNTSVKSPFPWPGAASVEVIAAGLSRGWCGLQVLDGRQVAAITPRLEESVTGEIAEPKFLTRTSLEAYLGVKMAPANAAYVRAHDPALEAWLAEHGALVRAVGGDELYGLADYTRAPQIVEPSALQSLLNQGVEIPRALCPIEKFRHSRPASDLVAARARAGFVFACSELSRTEVVICPVPAEVLIRHRAVAFVASCEWMFTVLQSVFHVQWAWQWGLRRDTGLVYSPKRCAATFPLPNVETNGPSESSLTGCARDLLAARTAAVGGCEGGYTQLYGRFHDGACRDPAVQALRAQHVAADKAVAIAYGWFGIPLDHGFRATKQGLRFTISEAARHEVLDRLLHLNHERHAQEFAATSTSAAEGRSARKSRGRPAANGTGDLFG